jgi:AcrR family transcriptional regulator
MEEAIINKAGQLFFRYGLKSVSMDDVAKEAGISKKTIYQHYADKEHLINELVDAVINQYFGEYKKCYAEATDAIDEVIKQSNAPFEIWVNISPVFFHELERSFSTAWNKLEAYRRNLLLPAISNNLQIGIADGDYRDELDVALTAEIRLNQLMTALQPQVFSNKKHSVRELMNELTLLYLHGITTPKGKKLLYKYIKNTNEKE